MGQRGFTLVEVTVAAAIAVILICTSLALACGRPAAAAAGLAFDAEIASAQSLARSSGNGATLVIQPAAAGEVMRLYSGRPDANNALIAGTPDVTLDAHVSESTLGAPPFTIFFDSAGNASAMRGAVAQSTVLPSDPGCPANAASLQIRIADARAVHTRTVVCAQ